VFPEEVHGYARRKSSPFVTRHEINAADRWSHVRLPAARTCFVHDGTPADRATERQRLTYRRHFEWREPGAAEASVLWTDEVTLQADDGRWLIDDFVHGGNWQFTVKGSMKKMLLNVAKLCS